METLTVRVIVVLAPEARGPGLVHVTSCKAAEHVQPGPTPETNANPVGNVSVTTMGPLVGPLPMFVTVIV
jgi:hypothetical protein